MAGPKLPGAALPERCPWCGHPAALVWVHGHGQCTVCGTNIEPCCQGAPEDELEPERGAPRPPPAAPPKPPKDSGPR